MTEQEIIEGNKLIAQFMGCFARKIFIGGEPVEVWGFKDTHIADLWYGDTFETSTPYHSSWDWLMPVVEKIESIYDDFHGYFGVHILSNICTIQGTKLNTSPESFHPAYMSDPNAIFETKIESTWYNVVEFIKWYNLQFPKP